MIERALCRTWRRRWAPLSVLLGVTICLLGSSEAAMNQEPLPIFCFWNTSSNWGPSPPRRMGIDNITAENCNVIVYSHASLVDDNGTVGFDVAKHKNGVVEGMKRLKTLNPNLKFLLAIGGSNDDAEEHWRRIAHLQRRFATGVLTFVANHGFDGVVLNDLPLVKTQPAQEPGFTVHMVEFFQV
ncbi:hypothetical protein ISCGN_028650 [Ixodes scapularis]